MTSPTLPSSSPFFGWRVVGGAFVVAVFGWGLGFYGPPIYLQAVRDARGWPLGLVSAAVTVHYLCGAVVVANLPGLYRRYGLARVTQGGSVLLALGLVGWATVTAPWQLFVATLLSGAGWVTLGAAAINAMIAPWFVRRRPQALSLAYNGASVGGIVFSPLWVGLIGWLGFAEASMLVGAATVAVIWTLTAAIVARTPEDMGQQADGDSAGTVSAAAARPPSAPLPHRRWSDARLRTLAAGMALGLFAQIGLLAHLFSLIVPVLGATLSGWVAALATAAAIGGRTLVGWLMPGHGDRRLWAAASYGVQVAGVLVLAASGLSGVLPIVVGVALFGFGIGNATSLPPLIAQTEFTREDAARVVPLIVATAQAAYAFAPAAFGVLREAAPDSTLPVLAATIAIQCLAAAAFLAGRRR